MRRDAIAVFLVIVVLGSLAIFGGIWAAGRTSENVVVRFEGDSGLMGLVWQEDDWEVSQGLYWSLSKNGEILQEHLICQGLPAEHQKRRFSMLSTRDGKAVALYQSVPERILFAIYDSESGVHWPGERNMRAHQELWREIAEANEISKPSYRDFNS